MAAFTIKIFSIEIKTILSFAKLVIFFSLPVNSQIKPSFLIENKTININQKHTKLTNTDRIKHFFGLEISKKIKISLKLDSKTNIKLNKYNFEFQLLDSSLKKVPECNLLRYHGIKFHDENKNKDSVIHLKNKNNIKLFFYIKKEWQGGYDGAVYSYKLAKGDYFLKIFFYNKEVHAYDEISSIVVKVK